MVTRIWDILVIPREGRPFRKKFSRRPELVMVLSRAIECPPQWAACYLFKPGTVSMPVRVERLTFRLHMTGLGMAYVEAER
jgi:hypothetical protein